MGKLVNKTQGYYTQISNEVINDPSLSWKAKGIYMYLLSKSDGWQFYMDEIKKHATDGKSSLQSGIKELVDVGLLERHACKNEDGNFDGWDWEILDPLIGKPVRRKTGQTEMSSDGNVGREIRKKDSTNNNNTNNKGIVQPAEKSKLTSYEVDTPKLELSRQEVEQVAMKTGRSIVEVERAAKKCLAYNAGLGRKVVNPTYLVISWLMGDREPEKQTKIKDL